jgi:hypothetical protein
MFWKSAGRLSFALGFSLAMAQAAPAAVYLGLTIVIDESGSVDSAEQAFYANRYINVLSDPDIMPLDGSVAVGIVKYSSYARLTFVNAPITDANFDALINTIATRTFPGGASAGASAIATASSALSSWHGQSQRQIISIATDGFTNSTADLIAARDAALLGGIDQINCLGTLASGAAVCGAVTGGLGSFAAYPTDAAGFEAAFARMITDNLASVPEPATWAMLIGGFGIMGAALRRKTRGIEGCA